ncbi:MAG: putative toxin-antitoxin system toxin component, PIN family [Terracidiphilus sp.]
MRVVLDTSVLVAAIRSQIGASKALVTAALESRLEFLISTPLILEYEAVLTRKEHLLASKLVAEEIREMLDMLCASGIQVRMTQDWKPKLRDPDDEMVLGTAINGRADVIATFNRKDFVSIPVEFGIEVLSPIEVLRRMEIQ